MDRSLSSPMQNGNKSQHTVRLDDADNAVPSRNLSKGYWEDVTPDPHPHERAHERGDLQPSCRAIEADDEESIHLILFIINNLKQK